MGKKKDTVDLAEAFAEFAEQSIKSTARIVETRLKDALREYGDGWLFMGGKDIVVEPMGVGASGRFSVLVRQGESADIIHKYNDLIELLKPRPYEPMPSSIPTENGDPVIAVGIYGRTLCLLKASAFHTEAFLMPFSEAGTDDKIKIAKAAAAKLKGAIRRQIAPPIKMANACEDEEKAI